MTFVDPITTTVGFGSWFTNLNTATDGWFGFMLLLAIFVVFFISFIPFLADAAFSVASFATLMIGLGLYAMDMISSTMIFILVILAALSLVFISISRGSRA